MARKNRQADLEPSQPPNARAREGLLRVAAFFDSSPGAEQRVVDAYAASDAKKELRAYGERLLRPPGKLPLAERAFRCAGSEIPRSLLLEAAQEHVQRGYHTIAIQLLARAEAPDELVTLGMERLEAKDLVNACIAFHVSRRDAPIDALLTLFVEYIESRDPMIALPALQSLVTDGQLYALADRARAEGNIAVAAWIYKQLLRRGEGAKECLRIIAEELYNADNTAAVTLVLAGTGITISTRTRVAYVQRQLACGKHAKALSEYEVLVAEHDRGINHTTATIVDPELHVAIGDLLLRGGWFKDGRAAYLRAKRPLPPELLAQAYAAIIEQKDACEIRAILSTKDLPRPPRETLVLFGRTLLDAGHVQDALELLASIGDPLTPDALVACGDALFQQGMVHEAREAYRAALTTPTM